MPKGIWFVLVAAVVVIIAVVRYIRKRRRDKRQWSVSNGRVSYPIMPRRERDTAGYSLIDTDSGDGPPLLDDDQIFAIQAAETDDQAYGDDRYPDTSEQAPSDERYSGWPASTDSGNGGYISDGSSSHQSGAVSGGDASPPSAPSSSD